MANATSRPGGAVADDVLAICRDAVVVGTVEGDIYFLGQSLTIRGQVSGDVFAIGERVDVDGIVNLSVRTIAQSLTISGRVGRGVAGIGQRLAVEADGEIGGNVYALGERLSMGGRVGGGLRAGGNVLAVNGPVGGDLAYRGERLTLGPNARITGSARYEGPNEPERHARADEVEWVQPQADAGGADVWGVGASVLMRFGMGLAMGLTLLLLLPGSLSEIVAVGARPLMPILVGGLLFVGLPFAAILCALTFVGIPVAIAAGVFWVFLVYAARVAASLMIGRAILGAGAGALARIARLALGLVILALAMEIPVLGGFVWLFTAFFGIGCFALWSYRSRRAIA